MARIDIVRIPYNGGNAALNDVLGGQVEMTFAVAATAAPQDGKGHQNGGNPG